MIFQNNKNMDTKELLKELENKKLMDFLIFWNESYFHKSIS
jgi:hypothetical protein